MDIGTRLEVWDECFGAWSHPWTYSGPTDDPTVCFVDRPGGPSAPIRCKVANIREETQEARDKAEARRVAYLAQLRPPAWAKYWPAR